VRYFLFIAGIFIRRDNLHSHTVFECLRLVVVFTTATLAQQRHKTKSSYSTYLPIPHEDIEYPWRCATFISLLAPIWSANLVLFQTFPWLNDLNTLYQPYVNPWGGGGTDTIAMEKQNYRTYWSANSLTHSLLSNNSMAERWRLYIKLCWHCWVGSTRAEFAGQHRDTYFEREVINLINLFHALQCSRRTSGRTRKAVAANL
jgi:hypothetical protein